MIQKKREKKINKKEKESLHIFSKYVLPVIAIILIMVVFFWAYYFVIAPNSVSKQFIEKPSLPENSLTRIKAGMEVINSNHINYVINEIGAYKLHNSFGTGDFPVIEFILTDVNKTFYSYIQNNMPVTKQGYTKNKDIILKGSQETILNILKSTDVLGSVREAKNNNIIQVELVSDMMTLIAKGYLPVYETLK